MLRSILSHSIHDKVVQFVDNIVDIPIEQSYQRCREEWGKKYIQEQIDLRNFRSNSGIQLLKYLIRRKYDSLYSLIRRTLQ